jgi:mono/diheme cytochrome c family protein
MTVLPQAPAARSRRRPLFFAAPWAVMTCAGCGLLAACVVAALAINAVYWTYRINGQGGPPAPPAADVRAEWEALPAGSAASGEQVFNGDAACAACHSLEPDLTIIGPSVAGIAARAATRKPDYSAELYLYESIAHPSAFVVEGFQPNLMPADFGSRLSDQQLADLVAYLMTR